MTALTINVIGNPIPQGSKVANHPTSSLPGAVVVEQQTQAAQACRAHCPVVAECLASQLALEMPGARVGVWGGTTPTDRTHITQDQEAS